MKNGPPAGRRLLRGSHEAPSAGPPYHASGGGDCGLAATDSACGLFGSRVLESDLASTYILLCWLGPELLGPVPVERVSQFRSIKLVEPTPIKRVNQFRSIQLVEPTPIKRVNQFRSIQLVEQHVIPSLIRNKTSETDTVITTLLQRVEMPLLHGWDGHMPAAGSAVVRRRC